MKRKLRVPARRVPSYTEVCSSRFVSFYYKVYLYQICINRCLLKQQRDKQCTSGERHARGGNNSREVETHVAFLVGHLYIVR